MPKPTGYLNQPHMLEQMKTFDIKLRIKIALHNRNLTMRQLSQQMGYNKNYLQEHMKKKEMPLSLLLVLSHHLEVNLLEPYMLFMPPEVKKSPAEKALQQQVAELQQQITALQRERDLFKEVAMK